MFFMLQLCTAWKRTGQTLWTTLVHWMRRQEANRRLSGSWLRLKSLTSGLSRSFKMWVRYKLKMWGRPKYVNSSFSSPAISELLVQSSVAPDLDRDWCRKPVLQHTWDLRSQPCVLAPAPHSNAQVLERDQEAPRPDPPEGRVPQVWGHFLTLLPVRSLGSV